MPRHLLLDSGAYVNCTGDLSALDPSSLVPVDKGVVVVSTAEGHEIHATFKGKMPAHVHGAGVYAGDNRIVTFTDTYYMPGLPDYRRIVSAGFL